MQPNFRLRLRICFSNSDERERRFQPAKELDFIQKRIKPAVGDAIIHIKRLRVVALMMLGFQHQPLALQPARESRRIVLMSPLVKLVSGHCGHRHQSKRDSGKSEEAGIGIQPHQVQKK